MIWLLIPIFIWTLALIIMGLPQLIYQIVQKVKVKLRKEAKLARRTNPDESMYKAIEEDILDVIHMRGLHLIGSIVGLILIALGTVALCAVLLL
jgi:hypothetical protein